MMSKLFNWFIQPLLVILIIALGVYYAQHFALSEKSPKQAEREVYAPLVQTITAIPQQHTIRIQSQGAIEAKETLDLVSPIGGRVIYAHPALRAGGKISKGEVLLKLEQQDYRLMMKQREAELASLKAALRLEMAEAGLALDEWQAINPGQEPPPLVIRQPQIDQARAEVRAAEASLAIAKLELSRTEIEMPFNGRVIETEVNADEFINANEVIARLYNHDQFEIAASVSIEELHWINIPDNDSSGSAVEIHFSVGEKDIILPGRVVRIDSQLHQRTRLAHVFVRLDAKDIPTELKETVIPGLFVELNILGAELENITVLPKSVLKQDGIVWKVVDGRLSSMKPQIVRRTGSTILVRSLEPGVRIVSSSLELETEGMQVRTQELSQ